MLEVHRCRQIEWAPSAVVALATSVNGAVVAAARENGAIELWSVAAGSVGWHCQLRIPGRQDAAVSTLVWCETQEEDAPLGRLFSAGLDGFITEWDLHTLQPKEVVESNGGSVWQLAAEPMVRPSKEVSGMVPIELQRDDTESDDESCSSESDDDAEDQEQRVAVACDDGCVRLFAVSDSQPGMVYRRSCPRVKGRILSVAWSLDGTHVVAGGSDGCIRCWDITSMRELYRITAGIGGKGNSSDLCIWSLLVLRDGSIVSGDSSGSTQFWDGQQGTLLQAQTRHGADVLALTASPSHHTVFAAGADGQVVQFQWVEQGSRIADGASTSRFVDIGMGALGDKWVYVGGKRTHTHDVRALAMAFPLVVQQDLPGAKRKRNRWRMNNKKLGPLDHRKWAQPGTAMLISGGNDSKLFIYPANAFLSFHPYDICPAPQRPFIHLACESTMRGGTLMMAQHPTWVDVWKICTKRSAASQSINGNGLCADPAVLGKRKREVGKAVDQNQSKMLKCNGRAEAAMVVENYGNGDLSKYHPRVMEKAQGTAQGTPPVLLARIKCKTAEHIRCSAISGNGRLIAFSDCVRPRLYELEQQQHIHINVPDQKTWKIKKRKLPAILPAAHCLVFSVDSTRLLVACPLGLILVVDIEDADVVHTFQVPSQNSVPNPASSPITLMSTSPDGQWLAAATSSGHIIVFNLETFRHHWTVPVLDGTPATAAVFHTGSSNALVVSSAANRIHVLDVEMKALGEWSKLNSLKIAKHLMDFPGGIVGLSVAPSTKSTSIIAYSSSAMCHIDFKMPIRDDVEDSQRDAGETGRAKALENGEKHVYANGDGKNHVSSIITKKPMGTNFVIIPFKDPVLFLGHTDCNAALVVEKPWIEILRQFPAPVFRHVYGT